MDKVHRAFARNSRDEARLLATGRVAKGHIYREDRNKEQWGNWRMREGERLGVVNGLLAFGTSRKAMMAALDKVAAWGAIIVDLEAGFRSDKDAVKLLDLGLAKHHGERSMKPGQAESMNGASIEARTKGRMPKRSALVHWRNPALTAKQAIRLMRGWTRPTAYNLLGNRGLPSGRSQIEA